MNQQLLDKILGEWRETEFAKNGGSFIECCDYEGMYEQLESFLTQSLTTAYTAGQSDFKKEVLGKIPRENKPYLGSENQDEYIAFSNGFNLCREEIIKLIENV